MFGTDTTPRRDAYRMYYRFLETDDEYFDCAGGHQRQGFWMIYGVFLPEPGRYTAKLELSVPVERQPGKKSNLRERAPRHVNQLPHVRLLLHLQSKARPPVAPPPAPPPSMPRCRSTSKPSPEP